MNGPPAPPPPPLPAGPLRELRPKPVSKLERGWKVFRENPFLWPLPPIVLDLLVILFSSETRSTMVEVASRYGPSSEISLASRQLVFAGVILAAWALSFAVPHLPFVPPKFGMRTPTEQEVGCAALLLRGVALALLYVTALAFAWRAIR